MKKTIFAKTSGSSLSLFLALGILLIVGLGCGSSTPAPPAYVGFWQGEDGSTITIRADGGADYKSGGTSVTGGGVTVDEGAKTLKISMAGSCEYCQAHVTAGEFDWVLSKIEQDDTYRG